MSIRSVPAVLMLLAPAVYAAEPLADLSWMSGEWCAQSGATRFEERWTPAVAGQMLALTRSLRGDQVAGFEFLRIEADAGRWVYVAQPGGRAPTRFPATETGAQRVVFANPEHDFPTRIEYWRDATGLHALVSGPGRSGAADVRFDYLPGACPAAAAPVAARAQAPAAPRTMAEVLAASGPDDWRRPDPAHTLYLELDSGRVVIELAPSFAPRHVANILALAREGYYDGLAILRVQDNFVVQWGDPNAEDPAKRKPIQTAARTLPAEFTRPNSADLRFTRLPDRDGYAADVGFSEGFPAARDFGSGRAWMAHCYGALGVGRDNDVNSGSGTELYVVTGHAPRQLDQNITLAGRVLQGMELLSALPRGTGALGFYERAEQRVPIRRVRVAADLPEAERSAIEVLRTDTDTYTALIESRRNRRDEWYKHPAGHIDLCSVPIPVRAIR